MTIGFDFRMGGSVNAGIGRYSFELLCVMLDLNRGKHKFIVFYNESATNGEDIKVLRNKGAQLVVANFRHYSLSEQIFFPRLLNEYKLDLIHFPNFNVPVLYSGRYIVTIHDLVHHKISGHKKARYHKFLAYKFIVERAIKNAEKVISVTEAAKEEILSFIPTDPNKIAVTYEAPNRYQGQSISFEKIASQYLLTRPYLLFVGTLERKKNLINLVKGFDKFISKYKFDMDLVIAGKVDPHYPEIRTQMLQIKHRDNLVFTGFIPNDVQATLYKNAFAFITASMHEGFGLPGLEAMEYGIPVLAANTKVFNEVYDNAAIFFDGTNTDDIAEKIHILVNDQPFYERMQKKSLERSVEFDWQLTARKTLTIYQEAMQDFPTKPIAPPEPEIE
ncbi:MAG TPA: glycosyltransferase family 1 protein [Candidatus Doudnabacteria bacterium]|nr:glycosyltransferase family 1 protein [Candidatus Doudnabacteria bacterium]